VDVEPSLSAILSLLTIPTRQGYGQYHPASICVTPIGDSVLKNFLKTKPLCFVALMTLAGVVSGSEDNGPVREAVSRKDIYQEAYTDGFPMIAAYKAVCQFNVDKANSQYKAPQIWNSSKVFTSKETAIVTPDSYTPYYMLRVGLRTGPIVSKNGDGSLRRFLKQQESNLAGGARRPYLVNHAVVLAKRNAAAHSSGGPWNVATAGGASRAVIIGWTHKISSVFFV
jgi:hypothetical protein